MMKELYEYLKQHLTQREMELLLIVALRRTVGDGKVTVHEPNAWDFLYTDDGAKVLSYKSNLNGREILIVISMVDSAIDGGMISNPLGIQNSRFFKKPMSRHYSTLIYLFKYVRSLVDNGENFGKWLDDKTKDIKGLKYLSPQVIVPDGQPRTINAYVEKYKNDEKLNLF